MTWNIAQTKIKCKNYQEESKDLLIKLAHLESLYKEQLKEKEDVKKELKNLKADYDKSSSMMKDNFRNELDEYRGKIKWLKESHYIDKENSSQLESHNKREILAVNYKLQSLEEDKKKLEELRDTMKTQLQTSLSNLGNLRDENEEIKRAGDILQEQYDDVSKVVDFLEQSEKKLKNLLENANSKVQSAIKEGDKAKSDSDFWKTNYQEILEEYKSIESNLSDKIKPLEDDNHSMKDFMNDMEQDYNTSLDGWNKLEGEKENVLIAHQSLTQEYNILSQELHKLQALQSGAEQEIITASSVFLVFNIAATYKLIRLLWASNKAGINPEVNNDISINSSEFFSALSSKEYSFTTAQQSKDPITLEIDNLKSLITQKVLQYNKAFDLIQKLHSIVEQDSAKYNPIDSDTADSGTGKLYNEESIDNLFTHISYFIQGKIKENKCLNKQVLIAGQELAVQKNKMLETSKAAKNIDLISSPLSSMESRDNIFSKNFGLKKNEKIVSIDGPNVAVRTENSDIMAANKEEVEEAKSPLKSTSEAKSLSKDWPEKLKIVAVNSQGVQNYGLEKSESQSLSESPHDSWNQYPLTAEKENKVKEHLDKILSLGVNLHAAPSFKYISDHQVASADPKMGNKIMSAKPLDNKSAPLKDKFRAKMVEEEHEYEGGGSESEEDINESAPPKVNAVLHINTRLDDKKVQGDLETVKEGIEIESTMQDLTIRSSALEDSNLLNSKYLDHQEHEEFKNQEDEINYVKYGNVQGKPEHVIKSNIGSVKKPIPQKKIDTHPKTGKSNSQDERFCYLGECFEAFTKEGMDNFLKLRIDSLKMSDINRINIIPVIEFFDSMVSENGNIKFDFTNHPVNILPLLIPSSFQPGDMHWVGIVAHEVDNAINIFYIDSENKDISSALMEKVIQAINNLHLEKEVTYAQINVEQQKYLNCGVELIENFIMLLTGTRASQEDAIYLQSQIHEDYLIAQSSYYNKFSLNEHNDMPDNPYSTEKEKKELFNLKFEADKLSLQEAVLKGDKEAINGILNQYSSIHHESLKTISNELHGVAIGKIVKNVKAGNYELKSYVKNLPEMRKVNIALYNKVVLNLKKLLELKSQNDSDQNESPLDSLHLNTKLQNQIKFLERAGYAFESAARHYNIQESTPEKMLEKSLSTVDLFNSITSFSNKNLPVNFNKAYKPYDSFKIIVSEQENNFCELSPYEYNIEYGEM
jgi:hypothetical protein